MFDALPMRSLVLIAWLMMSVCACGGRADEKSANAAEATVDDAVALMAKYRDKLCACADNACGDRSFNEYSAAAGDSREQLGSARATPEQGKRMDEIAKQVGACKLRLQSTR